MANGAATPPRRSGLVQTRSGDARRKLIEAAARELWNEGSFEDAFEATTVADIARAAGMSKGTFYFHFASKQEILLEMAWATTRKMVEELLTAAQHNVNVIFVVLNNGGYGAMKAFGELLDVKDARGLDLPDLNFEQVATGFGLHATRVSTHTELVDALNTVRPDGPRLLNVLIEPAADALY